MSRAVRHRSAVAAILSVAVAGCGSSPKPPPAGQQEVKQVLRSYLHAQTSGDGQTACSLLTSAAQNQLETVVQKASNGLLTTRPTCQDAVRLVRAVAGASVLGALATAQITNVQVQGNTATAEISDGTVFAQQQVTLQRSGGSWKIAGVPGLGG